VFSGGSYEEVGRWLWNFLTSHAKREDPRAGAILDAGDEREGKSYGARVALGGRQSAPIEFDYRLVAERRGSLAWCAELAARIRQITRELSGETVRVTAP
jgi:hypothetical protein